MSIRPNQKNTSSGHGAFGMGGQPSDDPRDLEGGHEGVTDDDRTRDVPGASGGRVGDVSGGSVAGVSGDKDAVGDIDSKGT